MKNIFCFVLVITLVSSCKISQVTNDSLVGAYTATGKDYNYRLLLNRDNTFQFNFKVLEANSGCEGKWQLKGPESLILSCNEPKNDEETLQGGYMSVRTQELKIKNEKELIYNGIILKKTNQ